MPFLSSVKVRMNDPALNELAVFLYQKPINLCQWTPSSEVIPGLHLGSVHLLLEDRLTFTLDWVLTLLTPPEIDFFPIPVNARVRRRDIAILEDAPEQSIVQQLERNAAIIRRHLAQGKNVFVHCHAGMSRSATVIAFYLWKYGLPKKKKPSLLEVFRYLRQKRPIIRPNFGFIRQLVAVSRVHRR